MTSHWRSFVTILLPVAVLGACGRPPPEPAAVPTTRPPIGVPEVIPKPVLATGEDRERLLPREGDVAALSRGRWIEVRDEPGARSAEILLDTRNPFGQRLRMLVTDAIDDEEGNGWVRLLLPVRPNGRQGWVRADDVSLKRVRERIEVDLSRTTLEYYRDDRLVERFAVGIGQAQFPTATGTFYIWARVPQPSPAGPYGNYALGISGFSPVITDWDGGGRMAIHGTPDPGDRGERVSFGCIRVYNQDMKRLSRVAMGTPVIISR